MLLWRSAGEHHAVVLRHAPFNGRLREMSEGLQARLLLEVKALLQIKP